MATEGLLPLRKKKKKKNAPLPKGVTENRQPYNVFEEEKIMQSAAEAMRQMRNIEKGAELSSQLAQKVRLRGTTGYHGCSECLSRATNKRPGG